MGQRPALAIANDASRASARREFLHGLTAAGVLFATVGEARRAPAKPAGIPRVGYPTLVPVKAGEGAEFLEAFRQGLATQGYLEGRNIAIELRHTGGAFEQLPRIIDQLVQLPVSVFVLPLSNTVLMAAKATRTIPIVSTLIGDPVALGLAQSLAHPTANVTGLTVYSEPLTGKRLELLKEVAPAVRSVGLLRNAAYPETAKDLREAELVAPRLGLKIARLDFNEPQEMLPVLGLGIREGIDSLVVVPDAVSATRYAAIVHFATTHRLPGVYHHERFVEPASAGHGGLLAFGPDRVYNFRRAAFYVDRLLKGTRPQNLPFEQPTRYRLVVSRRAARHLNLTVSESLLLRADVVFD